MYALHDEKIPAMKRHHNICLVEVQWNLSFTKMNGCLHEGFIHHVLCDVAVHLGGIHGVYKANWTTSELADNFLLLQSVMNV